jgi:hypothetical protein
MRTSRALTVVFAVSAFANGIALASAGQQSTKDQSFSLLSRSLYGVDNFHDYCSPCHGRDGTGHGPVAAALTVAPPDLTRLSAKNHGVFPRARVRDYITNGAGDITAHGTSAMPVWGPTFRALDSSDRSVAVRISNLVEYLSTVQK